jgi:hypothetical protein
MRFADSFRAARWVRLINLILQAVLFVTFFAGLNYIALRHTWRFDLSEAHRASLSPETKAYLDQLEQPVSIVVTITDDKNVPELAQVYHDISALLREYNYTSSKNDQGKITVKYLDVFVNRKEAEELDLAKNPNTVTLICGENRRVLLPTEFYLDKKKGKEYTHEAFRGEAALTAAILDVSSKDKKKIYFLEGHGELKPDDVSASGLSLIRDQLRVRNFELPTALNLSQTRKVPEDAALIIIAGQKERFNLLEQELLRNYLQTRAGRLILMVDPWRNTGLENLIFEWGVIIYDKQIFDEDPKEQDDYGNLHLWHFLPHPITDILINNELPIVVGPTLAVSEDIGRARDDGLTVRTLIKTSPTAWGETSYRLRRNAEYTPGEDLRLKEGLGVLTISERLKPANNLPLSIRGGRLAVFGSSDVVTNNRLSLGNLNLFLSTVNWCVDRDTQLNIAARPIERYQLPLSQEQMERLRLGLLFIVPGVVALLGFIVYWTRRH